MRSLFALLVFAFPAFAAEPMTADLFQGGVGGYNTYRIPGMVVTKRGSILAYCEARKIGRSDWGDIDVVMRRSTNGGHTFDAPRKLVDPPADAPKGRDPGVTVNNPVAIADMETGAVHFLYCVQYARCYYMRSDDDGATFSAPVDITGVFESFRPKYDWTVFATGPGHGIRLRSGRLIVPVWLAKKIEHRPSCVSTLYSDDAGKTWQLGDIVATDDKETPNPSETVPLELNDGSVMFNLRNESPKHRRLVSVSKDGVTGWSKPAYDETLVEPVCMASILRVPPGLIVWANPVGEPTKPGARSNLTVRVSTDDAKTWAKQKVLQSGPAAYSDLAVLPDGHVLCLYECDGEKKGTRALRFAKFKLDWLNE